MEEGRRTVLVAALSAYVEQLANYRSRLNLEEGKGKAKASEDDVDLNFEVRDQLKVVEELSSQLMEKTVRLQSLDASLDPFQCQDDSNLRSSKPIESVCSYSKSSFFYDEGPIVNLCTGLPIFQETGYEPGPSTRPPPPIRKAPNLPPNKPPTRPPKPSRLRSPSSLVRSVTSPPQRQPPLPPPYDESQELQ